MVIWIIGLSGAGKTTIGREVFEIIKLRKPNVVFLDGDHVRTIMGEDLGHSVVDRRANAWRICRICQFLDDQNIDVVCCILSLFHDTQKWNRATYSQYFEVYIEVSMDVLEARDQKGLYSGAKANKIRDVVGIDIPFVPPMCPDLVLANGEPLQNPRALAEEILSKMEAEF